MGNNTKSHGMWKIESSIIDIYEKTKICDIIHFEHWRSQKRELFKVQDLLFDSLISKSISSSKPIPASDSSKPSQENIQVTGYKPQRKRIQSKSVSTAGLESQLTEVSPSLEEETREKLAVISKLRAVEDEKNHMVEELRDQLKKEKMKRKEDAEKARLIEDDWTRKTSELNMQLGEVEEQLNQEKMYSKSTKDQLDKTMEQMKEFKTKEKNLQEGEKKLAEEKAKYEKEKIKLAQEKLDVEKERINMQKMKTQREEEEHKKRQKMIRSLSKTTKTRYAFLVANTYTQSTSPLPGTEKSIQTVDKTLEMFGFKNKLVLNKDFDELTKELENWKLQCSVPRMPILGHFSSTSVATAAIFLSRVTTMLEIPTVPSSMGPLGASVLAETSSWTTTTTRCLRTQFRKLCVRYILSHTLGIQVYT